LEEFRLSRKLDPNYSYPYYDEFATLWEMGQFEQAVQVLQQWVDLHPNDTEGQQRLQEAREKLNAKSQEAPLGIPPAPRPH
jgi:predicted Zn-dependent protease